MQGSFVTEDGFQVEGFVAFIPDRLWVMEGNKAMATLAPAVSLVDGAFIVEVTPTNTGFTRWKYKVVTPAGTFLIQVPMGDPRYLKELIEMARKK